MKRVLIIISFIISIPTAYSQIADNWVFGYKCGFNFSSGNPTFFQSAISAKLCLGSSFLDTYPAFYSNSISDCDGNLLFYINGGCAWNKNNVLMPNYCFNDTASNGSHTGTKILKVLNNDSLYYIFYEATGAGLRFAIVNMNADSGRGTILSTHNFINNYTDIFPPELIKHTNDSNFWLVCKPNETQMFSYLITSAGVSLTPVISTATGIFSNRAPLRASLSGNYLLYSDKTNSGAFSSVYCCDFNRSTGSITSIKTLFNRNDFVNPNVALENAEFSPNDSFVYINTSVVPSNNARITQFKRYLNNPGSSPIELAYISNNMPGMRLAPNGKIYLSNSNTIISCITRPDEYGYACNFVYNYIDISPDTTRGSFPSVYFKLRRLKFTSNAFVPSSCISDSVYLLVQGDTTFLNYRWYIYNSNDSIIDSTDIKNPVLWLANGIYKIKLRAKNPECYNYTWWTDNIYVHRNPKVIANIDSEATSCSRHFVRIKYHAEADSIQVNWNDGITSVWVKADTAGYLTHNYYDSSFVYPIKINVKNINCNIGITISDSVKLQPKPKAKFYSNNISKTFPIKGCSILQINLIDSSKNADSTWYIAKNSSGANFQFSTFNFQLQDTGWFDIVQYTSTKDGCIDSFVVKNAAYVAPKPTIKIQVDSTFKTCIQDYLRLKIISSFNDSIIIYWGDGKSDYLFGALNSATADTITHHYTSAGSYFIKAASNNRYCASLDSLIHLVRPPLQIKTSSDTTICKGRFANLWIVASGADSTFTYILKGGNILFQNNSGLFLPAPSISTSYFIGAINACAMDTIWKQINVTVRSALALTAHDTTLCKGASDTLRTTASGGDSTNYNFTLLKLGQILQSNSTGVFVFSTDTTTNYALVLSDGCSVNDTIKLTVTIRPPLKLLKVNDSVLCKPGYINLQALGLGGDSASYNFRFYKSGLLLQSNHQGRFTFFNDSNSAYSIILNDICGTEDTINFKVLMSADLKLKVNFTDTAICKGSTINIVAIGIGGNGNYFYSLFNSKLQVITTNSSGIFTIAGDTDKILILKITDNCNSKIDSAIIHIKVIASILNDTVTVLYTTVIDSFSTVTVWNKLQDAVSYSIHNKNVTDTFFVHHNAEPYLKSEKYFVTATNQCGYKSSVSAIAQTIYLQGENKNFNEFALLQYTPYETWKNGVLEYHVEYFDKKTQSWIQLNTLAGNILNAKSEVIPDSSGTNISTATICYRIVAIEKEGNKQLTVSNVICIPVYPVVFLPNAFSPNGDGLNDYYKPICAGLNAYQFEIYDRWGALVYSDTPESIGWDGTFNGKALPVGAYTFRLSAAGQLVSPATNNARRVERKGLIYLVR